MTDPTYVVDGVIHYCVANMPGGVARTSTFALNNVTLPFAMAIANKGWKKALADDVHLKNGLNVAHGKVTYKAVADDLGYAYVAADKVIGGVRIYASLHFRPQSWPIIERDRYYGLYAYSFDFSRCPTRYDRFLPLTK